jgi:hypothetical protein
MWISHWNPVPKVTFRNRRPILRNKNRTIFIVIYTLEWLFLWYLYDLDLWLSVITCGVMSTITFAYTYRHKYKKNKIHKITKQLRLSSIKVYQFHIDPSYLTRLSLIVIDPSYPKRFSLILINSSHRERFSFILMDPF